MGPKYKGNILGHLEIYYSESIFNSVKEICEYELIYYYNINNNMIMWATVSYILYNLREQNGLGSG